MAALSAFLSFVASVTFFVELFLFGALSGGGGGDEQRRGDRFAAWLVRTSERMNRLGTSPFATVYRWVRNILIILFFVFLIGGVILVVMSFLSPPEPTPPDPSSGFQEAVGQIIGGAIAAALVPVILLAIFIVNVMIGIGILLAVYIVQIFLFGFRGGRPLAAIVLGFMGRHVRGILTASAAVGALSGIVGFFGLFQE